MDLLTQAELDEFRSAMIDVADTFFDTPVIYRKSEGSFDRFEEDRVNNTSYTDYPLKALREYGMLQGDKFILSDSGVTDNSEIRLTVNNDQLTLLGLWDIVNNQPLFTTGEDYLICGGIEYRIIQTPLDGPIEDKAILTVIIAEPIAKKAD